MTSRFFKGWRGVLLLAAVFALGALAISACGDGSDDDGPTPTAPAAANATPAPLSGSITVFAAASLTDAFHEIATEFKKTNPGVEINFNFQGSSALRTQLEQGARADVFASADTVQMDAAKKSGVIAAGDKVFVRNSLVLITPKTNPANVKSVADLKNSGLKLVLAAPEVPVGNYARQMLTRADSDPAFGAGFSDAVLKNLVSNESNVKQVVAKVQLGEADAGIVYGSDVTPSVAGELTSIAVPASINPIAEYPIALVKGASNAKAAQAFVDFVTGSSGQSILKKWGFQTV
jgi:molybdate transport system substrate-binding protein